MDIFRSLDGMVTLELTSADPMAFFRIAGIPVYDLEKITELQYRFRVLRQDARYLRKLASKRGETLKLCHREGLFWLLKNMVKRPVLVLGLSALLCISLWVPGRIFFVQVEGNTQVPTAQIIEKAQACGIGFGASRREVRSEIIKNNLLSAMPQLQWAGVNTYGCVAVITVREREVEELPSQSSGISSIRASQDGIIRQITVLQGNALVKPGQAVKAGQVLISGYTDCGIYIQGVHAEGEVYALTQREISAVFPTIYAQRQKNTVSKKSYSLIIGKKRINFEKDSGISGGSCAKIASDYHLILPGGFALPVTVQVQTVLSYNEEPIEIDAQEFLPAFARRFVTRQMVAGSIESAGHVFTQLTGAVRLDGVYSCYEMIGTEHKEENLLDYGKNN